MRDDLTLFSRRSLLLRGAIASMMASLGLLSIVKASTPSSESASEFTHETEFVPENDYPFFGYKPDSFA